MRRFCYALLVVLAVFRATGAVTVGVTSLTITNPTDFIIAADALSGSAGTERDAIQIRTVVRWTNDAIAAVNETTRYEVRLLANGSAVSILNEAGAPASVYRFTNSVSVPGGFGGGSTGRTNIFPLTPVGQFSPYVQHTAELRLFDGAKPLHAVETSDRQFWHFTNLVSGDAALNVLGAMEISGWQKNYLVDTVPTEDALYVSNRFRLLRFDDFNTARSQDNIRVRLSWQLQDTNGVIIPTTPASSNFTVGLFNYEATTPRTPSELDISRVISFRPNLQLNSVSNRYRVIVSLAITNTPGLPAVAQNSATTPNSRVLHYNGNLIFGGITATLTNLDAPPELGLNLPGQSYVLTELDGRALLTDTTPDISFPLNGPRAFRLFANGDAVLSSGSISVPLGSAAVFTNGNVRIRRISTSLTTSGATADLRFYLPAGFGVTTNYSVRRTLDPEILFQDVPLNEALEPANNIVRDGAFFAVTESKPIIMGVERLEWNVTSQNFRLTPHSGLPAFGLRLTDQAGLNSVSNLLANPQMAIKRANDGYYQYVNDINGLITVSAAPGNVALVNFTAGIRNGTFAPHFPTGPVITWTNGGSLQVAANSVIPGANSRLEGVSGIIQRYISSCAGCDGELRTNAISLLPTNRYFNFTRDGGGVAVNDTSGFQIIQSMEWGFSAATDEFAHRAPGGPLSFLMSGNFLRRNDYPRADSNSVGVLHLTGVAATNLAVIERPFTSDYNDVGRADYAGMNLRSAAAGTSVGRDVITGVPVEFSRTGRAKYYARLGGVTGIHEAMPNSFDDTLTLLGYPFTFETYGFSFLDSVNRESRTAGAVSVPYPGNFTLPFEKLTLTCPGGLDDAQLVANTGYRVLEYWQADFLPQSIRFQGQPGLECDPTQAYLVVGARVHASYVSQPLSGTLGFYPNGSLIPPSANLPGVESRFELPSQFRFAGPTGAGDWVLTPVSPAFFTGHDPVRAPDRGYMNIVGALNVPFFENIKAQLHTGARTNGEGIIRMAGGWPNGDAENELGWEVNNKTYFTHSNFDDANRGFPTNVDIDDYTAFDGEDYRPQAQRTWLDVVDLRYTLDWDSSLRYFRSWTPSTANFFIVSAEHQVSYLDPRRAVIDLGERYDGLPVVTLQHFLVDENGGGAASAMRAAISDPAYDAITTGIATTDGLLSENPSYLADRLLAAGVDDALDEFMDALEALWADAKADGQSGRTAFLNDAIDLTGVHFYGGPGVTDNAIRNRLLYLGIKSEGGQLFTALNSELSQIATGIRVNANSFNGGSVGAEAIRNLVDISAAQFNSSVAGPELEAALGQNASAFQQLSGLMMTAHHTIAGYTNGMVAATSEWAQELESEWNQSAGALRTVATNSWIDTVSHILDFNWRIDDPLIGDGAAAFRHHIRTRLADRLASQSVLATIRATTKQRIADATANYRSAANSVFAQYNFIARDLISRSLASVDNNFAPGLGMLENYFAISRLQGHAEIQDDSLRELRLDARVQLKVPDDLAFNAYLEIKEQNSENTPDACLAGPEVAATEIKFGANDVELDWISDGLRVNVGAKVNLEDSTPVGFAGSFETRGPLEFAGFNIKQVGFAMAFGKQENYLAANARVKLGQSTEIAGGLFFGRACEIEPLVIAVASVSPFLLVDVNPEQIFGEPPYAGGFVYAEGMFPVLSFGCLLEARYIAGAGGWFLEGGPRFGGIIKAGISGTAICVLTVSGDITMIGAKRASGMTFIGMAHVEGCIGFWPLEYCVDANTTVSYTQGAGWDAEEP